MRPAEKSRDTKETKIYEKINLDGNGNSESQEAILIIHKLVVKLRRS